MRCAMLRCRDVPRACAEGDCAGAARFSSPLGVWDFVKYTSVLQLDAAALRAQATSITTLADILFRVAGNSVEIHHADPREGDIRLSVGNPSHAKNNLGVVVETEIEDGLRVTLESL